MSLIDQRILIVAPAEAVWSYLTSPVLMTKWHKGCKQVSILSTRPTGVGARRRCVDGGGRTSVEETTAWLENLGYEYVMIDGPYRQYRARLRLQAVAEGTVVNWTIDYHLRGVLPGVRNLFGWRRRVNRLMVDSLKQLKRLVESSGIQLDREKQARFAMQAAPDVTARAARGLETIVATRPEQPARPPSKVIVPEDDFDEPLPPLPAAPAVIRPTTPTIINMPQTPIVAPVPDTRKAIPGPLPVDRSVSDKEPSFVNKIGQEASTSLADTKPRRPQGLTEAIAAQNKRIETPLAQPSLEDSAELRAQNAMTVPISMVAPPPEPESVTQTMEIRRPPDLPTRLSEPTLPTKPEISLAPKPAPKSEPKIEPKTDTKPDIRVGRKETPVPMNMADTGQISIWDVFGVVRPSERAKAELEAVIASLQGPAKASFTASSMKQARQKVTVALRTPPQHGVRHKVQPSVRSFREFGKTSDRGAWRK